jgi:hypothetical protein
MKNVLAAGLLPGLFFDREGGGDIQEEVTLVFSTLSREKNWKKLP